MTDTCPACGQDLRRCPICFVGVLPDPKATGPIHHRPIKKHDDTMGRDCRGRQLDYQHTVHPRGAA
jgi:hypothetical protein